MILAGDIGGTRTRLAAFEIEGSKLKCVVEKTYPSQEHNGLGVSDDVFNGSTTGPQITIDAQVGVGQIEVHR